MKILVTGGAGYIGSHVVKELLKQNHEVLVVDNLSTGNKSAVKAPAQLIVADINDKSALDKIFKVNKVDAVMHFAALKNAADSVNQAEEYYETNVVGSLNLLNVMVANGVKKMIFSSSAAVYGEVTEVPISEDTVTAPINPYGKTKLMFEEILADYDVAYELRSVSLRYFNAGGADIEGELGNDNPEKEDLLSILMIAANEDEEFRMFGDDYDTKDGSAIRDLVHVSDLASAHIKALEYLNSNGKTEVVNLGSENGFSVKETAELVKQISGRNFAITVGDRRPGDVVISIASSQKARELLGWQAVNSDLETIVKTAWDWQLKHPRQKAGK